MPVVTRSRTAALRGLNPTLPSANQGDVQTVIRETAVKGPAGSRKPARGRRAKTNGTQTPINLTETGDSASTASRPGSKTTSRSEGENNRHVSQSQATSQTTSQTCGGLYVEAATQQVATTSNAAGSSSQPLPQEVNGAGAAKPRKGRRTTTKRDPKANAKTGRPGQQKKSPGSADVIRAGTKRRREDDEYYPETSDEDERESASATRPLRRVRRRTGETAAADALNHNEVDEAVNRTRRNKGKARAIDVPTTEEASTGSKRRRDEEDIEADDVRQATMDPGPSRRTTRRTRQRVEKPTGQAPVKKTVGKPRAQRNTVHARPPKVISRASSPDTCESEEPMFMPSPAPSIERSDEDERLASEEARLTLLVKQEDVTPSFFPCQPAMRLPVENPICRSESSMLLSPLMFPDPLVPTTAVVPYADALSLGGSIVKVEEPPSPSLGHDILPSPGGSDKENDPEELQRAQRRWPVKSEDIASHFLDFPIGTDADGNLVVEREVGSDEYDEYDEYDSNEEDDDEYPFYSVVRQYPRRPFAPMEIILSRTSEPEVAPSEDRGHTDHEDVVSGHSASGEEVPPEAVQREASPCPRDCYNAKDENTGPGLVSGRSSSQEPPVEGPSKLGDSRRTPPSEAEELSSAPLSLSGTVIANDPDQGTLQEHILPSSPVAELEGEHEAPSPVASSPVASRVDAGDRNNSLIEDSFVRSNAPSPSPFPQDRFLSGYPTPERHLSLPQCQCGNLARHFVVHSDGEASDFSFMGDDEDF